MRKKIIAYAWIGILAVGSLAGCGKNTVTPTEVTTTEATSEVSSEADNDTTEEASESDNSDKIASSDDMTTVEEVVEEGMVPVYATDLKEGTYDVVVSSSSSMFIIESCTLTVADGEMTAVMKMGGKGYLYIYPGTGEEAVDADESTYIPFDEDADGVHTFTFPVEALDEGLACTAFSKKKEKWYDRTILFRADSLPLTAFVDGYLTTPDSLGKEDGTYEIEAALHGGSGRASVETPAALTITQGVCTATIVWSSPNYDYMIIDGEKYLPVNTEGNSEFEIPVTVFDRNMPVIADTTAMSEPHEISYTLNFDSSTIQEK